MLAQIARFEVRYQLRSPLFAVATVLFFLLAFGSVTSENIRIGAGGNVHVNAPFAILQTVGVLNVFAIFVVTAFVANVIIRDDETGFAPLVRSTRLTKTDYLVGRFAGAFAVAFLVTLAVPLGMLVGSFMPWVDPETLQPLQIKNYLFAIFCFGLPTLAVMAAGFFALATATRSMTWTFIGVIVFLVLFATSRVMLKDPSWDAVSAWTDPFGMSALNQVTRYWTAAERNARLPELSGLLLYNRLLWLAIGASLFALAFASFRFENGAASGGGGGLSGRRTPSRKLDTTTLPPVQQARAALAPALDRPGQASKAGSQTTRSQPGDRVREHSAVWVQFAALVRFDMAFVLRSPAFLILLVLGLFNALAALTSTVSQRGVDYLPVTRAVIDALYGSFSLFPILIAIFYAGELVWRDRERRMHEIVDASAAPDWTFMLPKVLAIGGVVLTTFLVACLGAVAFQAWHGYTRLELMPYLLWFLLPNLISIWLLAVLSVFVQALVPHKFIGWAVMLLYVVGSIVLGNLGFEHRLYDYAATASVPLSDMNGMGHFWIGRAWHQAYWIAFAAILLVLAHLLWRRGVATDLRPRFKRLRSRLQGGAGWLLGASLCTWIGLGCWIFYNTNIVNRYETKNEREELAADFEKTLLPFESVPQPTIQHVRLDVALYPAQVRAQTRGTYTLENRTGQALAAIHIQVDPDLRIKRLGLQGAIIEKEYPRFGYRIYRLATPMQPGEQRTLEFETVLERIGFENNPTLTRIVGNGSFVDNFEITPMIGFSRQGLLQDRAKRRKYNLPPELRPASLEDASANSHHYLRRDSDWVTADITLSTEADQTPVAPGYVVSDQVVGGRRVLVTRTEAPIHHFFSLQSARYEVGKDQWQGRDGRVVDLAVYHHPPHNTNVQRMLAAMKVSLDVFTQKFSAFQFRQLRILEFPAYGSFAQSFANTVPYSESIGFVQNFKDVDQDEKIDLVTYITAHEIAHQWWAHEVIGADKQGMTLLSESFSQYGALLVMERLYGKAQLRKFLKLELDVYLRSRGGEVLEELPLNRVENQGYIHYQKGALAMYALKEEVGEAAVNRALQQLLAEFAFKPAPYPSSTDFLRLLRAQVGPAHELFISDLFERITLYDLKASSAKKTLRPDGKYEVRFTVEATKLYADGKGKESPAQLNESFDVGAFTVEPGKKGYRSDSVLRVERRTLRSGRQEVTLVTDKEPIYVGVDPFNIRIDRNSDDNFAKVE